MRILVTAAVLVCTAITLSFTTEKDRTAGSEHMIVKASLQDTVPGRKDTMPGKRDTMRSKRDTMRSDTTRIPR